MPLPNTMADLSVLAASCNPPGGEILGTLGDDYHRAIQSIVRRESARGADIPVMAGILTPGNDGNYFFVTTFPTTVTGISNTWVGRQVTFVFQRAVTIVHSSSLLLPGGANISAVAGRNYRFVQDTAAPVWRCIGSDTMTSTGGGGGTARASGPPLALRVLQGHRAPQGLRPRFLAELPCRHLVHLARSYGLARLAAEEYGFGSLAQEGRGEGRKVQGLQVVVYLERFLLEVVGDLVSMLRGFNVEGLLSANVQVGQGGLPTVGGSGGTGSGGTTFHNFITAGPGSGGGPPGKSATGTGVTGGGATGGFGSVASIRSRGQQGSFGIVYPAVGQAVSGRGGDSQLGSGGDSIIAGSAGVAAAGIAGLGFGSGGSGGVSNNSSSAVAGGRGVNGICIVVEFY